MSPWQAGQRERRLSRERGGSVRVAPRAGERGFTLIELIVTVVIVGIIASLAVPLARNSIQREREVQLRRDLRDVRDAIDRYWDACSKQQIQQTLGTECYPESLDVLVDGVSMLNAVDKKLKFLRRIPTDPMTHSDWGMRSYQDDPTSTSWGGTDVYDIFTTSDGTALDGTKYKDW